MVCQLGLTGRLLLNERRDEVTDRFELMTMCPRQHKRDIIAQTSRLRVLRCHTPRLSQELSPWLLVTSENVSRHQLGASISYCWARPLCRPRYQKMDADSPLPWGEDCQSRKCASLRPTVSLGVTSAVASSCEYYRGQIEPRVAQ